MLKTRGENVTPKIKMVPGTNLMQILHIEFQEIHTTSQSIMPLFCQHLFSILTLCKIV